MLGAKRHTFGYGIDATGDHSPGDVRGMVAQHGCVVLLGDTPGEFDMGGPDQPFIPDSYFSLHGGRAAVEGQTVPTARPYFIDADGSRGNKIVGSRYTIKQGTFVDAPEIGQPPFFVTQGQRPSAFQGCRCQYLLKCSFS